MKLLDSPFLVLALSCALLWLAAEAGNGLRSRLMPVREEDRGDFDLVVSATLTLLGLLIGFSFSMAINRYDQRKNFEEEEANAIGTEYLRTDVLPPADGSKARVLLRQYLDQRILFYTTHNDAKLAKIDRDTAALQSALWAAVVPAEPAKGTGVLALALLGMNDVFNSQGYTQAAWLNRIPVAAWCLMIVLAICCNFLIGYRAHRRDWRVFVVLPITISIAFFLLADIDSMRAGVIRVAPQNLIILQQSLAQH